MTILFSRHFKYLYHHYGRILIINLVDKRDDEKRIGDEYYKLFQLLVETYQSKQKQKQPLLGYLTNEDFIWFDYHEQSRICKGLTPEQFIDRILIQNKEYSIGQELERQNLFVYRDGNISSIQQGVFRINCIDCLDRTNNVQLTIGLHALFIQLKCLNKQESFSMISDQIKTFIIGRHYLFLYKNKVQLFIRKRLLSYSYLRIRYLSLTPASRY